MDTRTPSGADPIADRNRRALARALADPAGAFAAMRTPAGRGALTAAATALGAAGQLLAAGRLADLSWCIDMGDPVHGGAGVAAEAAAWRCEVIRAADTARAGGGLTALAVGIEAGGMRPAAADPYRPRPRASLPRLHRVTVADARALAAAPETLPGFGDSDGAAAPDHQAALPGFETAPAAGCPSWILWLWAAGGGPAMTRGHGAPASLRLFVGALLHLRVSDRDGEWRTLRFPVAEVERWLHPGGWTNRRRDWHNFPAALKGMQRVTVPLAGVGEVTLVSPTVTPTDPSDPLVEFTVRLPAAAASGARLDWRRLCEYGADSAPAYRAYLAATAAMDRAAYHGAPATKQIGAPIMDGHARPVRGRGGRIRRRSDLLVPHPAARMVPRWSDADAARFVGFDPADRRRRRDARLALERLAADGVLDLERCADGRFALFAPRRADP